MLVSLSLSPVLFHVTSSDKLLQVLKTNKFELTNSSSVATDNDLTKDVYYLSTTRHRLGSYSLSKSSGYCLLTLDGNALSYNHKGKSVDYWGRDFYTSPNAHAERNEAEDRVFTKKPQIDNAIKFIKQIDILFEDEVVPSDLDVPNIRNSARLAKKYGIPVFVYYNKKDWLTGNKNKARPISDFAITTPKPRKYRQFPMNNYLIPFVELYFKTTNQRHQLSKDSLELIGKLSNRFEIEEVVRSLSGDMSAARKADRTLFNSPRKTMDTLVKAMRKEGVTISEFVYLLRDKWV